MLTSGRLKMAMVLMLVVVMMVMGMAGTKLTS